MGLAEWVSKIVAFLRAGYPTGMPAVGYVPLLALLPRRASDDEITVITRELAVQRRGSIDTADVGVEIIRITHEMPLPDDIKRIQHRLAEIGWSDWFNSSPKPKRREQPPKS